MRALDANHLRAIRRLRECHGVVSQSLTDQRRQTTTARLSCVWVLEREVDRHHSARHPSASAGGRLLQFTHRRQHSTAVLHCRHSDSVQIWFSDLSTDVQVVVAVINERLCVVMKAKCTQPRLDDTPTHRGIRLTLDSILTSSHVRGHNHAAVTVRQQ